VINHYELANLFRTSRINKILNSINEYENIRPTLKQILKNLEETSIVKDFFQRSGMGLDINLN